MKLAVAVAAVVAALAAPVPLGAASQPQDVNVEFSAYGTSASARTR